jgi:hypothetical protein
MRYLGFLLGTAFLASGVMPASATVYISGDRGGQIGRYLQQFASVRSSGERVVIDGNCLSACTMVLGLIPQDRMCATSRARFGFHAAWMPDSSGRPVTSALGTEALWKVYPGRVRHWINRHGGLSRRMIYLQGRDLAGIVPICGSQQARRHVRSTRRVTARSVRYSRAAAASDRR